MTKAVLRVGNTVDLGRQEATDNTKSTLFYLCIYSRGILASFSASVPRKPRLVPSTNYS